MKAKVIRYKKNWPTNFGIKSRQGAKKVRWEEIEQKAFFRLLLAKYPAAYPSVFHCPNGEARPGATAANLKLMGVKPGVVDIIAPFKTKNYGGFWGELKRKEKNKARISSDQKSFMSLLKENGQYVVVCYGAEDMLREFGKYWQMYLNEKGLIDNND